jgi:hypothetical protein
MTTSAREESTRLASLLRREHDALAEFLVALADFDQRGAWVELGYKSLFWFLHRDLGLSKSAAFYRKTAVELVQRFPAVLEPLRDGRLCLTSVAELAKVLTPENLGDVLPRFFTLSSREAKEVTAALLPAAAPPLRDAVTFVHAPATVQAVDPSAPDAPAAGSILASSPIQAPAFALTPSSGSAPNLPRANVPVGSAPVVPSRPTFEVEPLTADLRRLHITVSRRFLEKLEAARDALSHSHPGAGRDEILEVALDLVLDRQAKRRGLVKNPRPPASASNPPLSPRLRSRYVPAHIRRAVWERDGGQCQYPLQAGGICGETSQAELDHIPGFALGAKTTVEDMRVLCRFHQDVSARQLYGDDVMNHYTRPKGGGCSEPVAVYGERGLRAPGP